MDKDKSDESVELVLHDAEGKLEGKADEALDHALDVIEDKVDNIIESIENEEVAAVADVAVDIAKEVASGAGEKLIDLAGDKVFEKLEEQAKSVGVKRETLAVLLRFIMEAVEETPVKGPEQKDYAIRLLRGLIETQAVEPERSALLDAIDSGAVAGTIDLIVAATRGELNINQVAEVATSCVPCCISLFSKKSKQSKKTK